LRITGSVAKEIAAFLLAAAQSGVKNPKDPKIKLKGKERLKRLLQSGKELKIFAVRESDIRKFVEEAKRYGVVYCALRDRRGNGDGTIDIMAKAEDASKIQRIMEKLEFATVDRASIPVIEKRKIRGNKSDIPTPEISISEQNEPGSPLNEILSSPEGKAKDGKTKEVDIENPLLAKTEKSSPSEPISKSAPATIRGSFEKPESVVGFLRDSAASKKQEAVAPARDNKSLKAGNRDEAR